MNLLTFKNFNLVLAICLPINKIITMNNKIIYQAFFIGVRSFVYSPKFAKLQSAQNWIARNRHRVVEDLQIIKYNLSDRSQTEWLNDTGTPYDGWKSNPFYQY
jgi:hypothetical protein